MALTISVDLREPGMRAISLVSIAIQTAAAGFAHAAGNHELVVGMTAGSILASGLWIVVEVASLVRFMAKRV